MFSCVKKPVVSLALILLLFNNALAQSGRGRTPTPPPPQPKPAPNKTVVNPTVLGVPEGGKLVKQDLEGVTSRFALRNGLTVLVREKHSAPLVAVNIRVKTGILTEPDDAAGIARLTHKALLRGTATRNGAAIERQVAKLGGVFTSEVDYDHTSFTFIAPAESYQAMIELLADLFLNPAFKEDDVKKAAGEVLLDAKLAQDRLEQASRERLYSAAFATHRLKRGGAVAENFLASVKSQEVQAFYQAHYQPANTLITVLGDVAMLSALGQVQLQFGNFKSASAPQPAAANQPAVAAKPTPVPAKPAASVPTASVPTTEPTAAPAVPATTLEEAAQDKLRYINARADIGQSLLTFGYRTPALKGDKESLKELATLQVLAAVWGLGDGSRMYQGLREGLASRDKQSVASRVGAEFQTVGNIGILLAQMTVVPDRIDRAEAEYVREVERFRREIISEGELQRAKSLLEKARYDATATFESEVVLLADFQASFGDWRLFDSHWSRIRAVTAQDVQAAAAKYLTLSNTTVAEYEPRSATPRTFTPEKFAELMVTFAPTAGQPLAAGEAKPAVALKTFSQGSERNQATEGQNIIVASVPLPIKDFSVLRGPRAYVREDKSLPVISISVLFQGGRLIEEAATSGTTELMLRTMLKSTATKKGELIALELETYGGRLQIVNEPDFFGITMDVLSRNAEAAVKLLLDLVENPYFGKEEVAREKAILLADQLSSRDDDEARATELLWASLFPGHPYGLPRLGVADAVKNANEAALEAWHNKTIKRQYPMVLLVGDTDGSALVSRIFSEGLKRGDLDKTLKVSTPGLYSAPEDKIEQRRRVATSQAVGFRLGPATPPQTASQTDEQAVLAMLTQIAALGKINEEMRANLGLVDSLTIETDPRVAASIFLARF
ncbi:MAG TPA: insulinase family protein, partial [Blastocatellia bacterium]|nr:insulinase family protein [Blastocatellia bacterium]